MSTTSQILKEEIPQLRFFREEVLMSDAQKQERGYNLLKAERLGNAYHGKVKITFMQQNSEAKLVETTVWAFCNDYIVLKGGVTIPVASIIRVDF